MRTRRTIASVALALLLTPACGADDAPSAARPPPSVGGEQSAAAIDPTRAPAPAPPPRALVVLRPGPSRDPMPQASTAALPPSEVEIVDDATSVCPANIPTLEVRTRGVRDGAALELTARDTDDVLELRARMRELASAHARRQRGALAAELAEWDVPEEPSTARAASELDDEDDALRSVHDLRLIEIPRGVRLELRPRAAGPSASTSDLRERVRDDAAALRAGRCPLSFQPA